MCPLGGAGRKVRLKRRPPSVPGSQSRGRTLVCSRVHPRTSGRREERPDSHGRVFRSRDFRYTPLPCPVEMSLPNGLQGDWSVSGQGFQGPTPSESEDSRTKGAPSRRSTSFGSRKHEQSTRGHPWSTTGDSAVPTRVSVVIGS